MHSIVVQQKRRVADSLTVVDIHIWHVILASNILRSAQDLANLGAVVFEGFVGCFDLIDARYVLAISLCSVPNKNSPDGNASGRSGTLKTPSQLSHHRSSDRPE